MHAARSASAVGARKSIPGTRKWGSSCRKYTCQASAIILFSGHRLSYQPESGVAYDNGILTTGRAADQWT